MKVDSFLIQYSMMTSPIPAIPPRSSLPLLQSRHVVFHGSRREGEVDQISLVNWRYREKGEGDRGVRREEEEKGREHEESGGSSWIKEREGEQRKRYTLKEVAIVG